MSNNLADKKLWKKEKPLCAINLNTKKKYHQRPRGRKITSEQISAVQAKILKELLGDGRQADGEIAKKIGEPKKNVTDSIDEMKKMGIITGATIHINYKSFGYKAVAHLNITVEPEQEEQFTSYLQKMPELYSFHNRGPKGNFDVVAILRTLEQLNDIKDAIKRNFSVSDMKTGIWTDVKEMNHNLAIVSDGLRKNGPIDYHVKTPPSNPQMVALDQVDLKIADGLAENGRVSMETLGREVGVSPDTAKRRYEKLKKNGALKVTIQIDPTKIGYQALCIFFTATSHENPFLMVEKICEIPDIISVMKTTGDYDLQVWGIVKDIGELLSIQEELGKIQGILRTDMEIGRLPNLWPTPRQYISTF